jgi:Mg2+/Co2+ transporter CorC
MGGYVFSNYGVVPEDGTEFELELDRLHIRVTEIKDHRIIKMIVTVLEAEEEEDDEEKREKKSDKSEKTVLLYSRLFTFRIAECS